MLLFEKKQSKFEEQIHKRVETVLKSVSKEKLTNFEKTNLTYEKTDKKKK